MNYIILLSIVVSAVNPQFWIVTFFLFMVSLGRDPNHG